MNRLEGEEKKRFWRYVYALAFRYFGASLVCCAIIAGIARSRVYFVFALCAAGGVFLAWGWFTHLKNTGFKLEGAGELPKTKKRAPYMLRRDKTRWQKPAFARTNEDFEDDISDRTAVSAEAFSAGLQGTARMIARFACSALLFAASLLVRL